MEDSRKSWKVLSLALCQEGTVSSLLGGLAWLQGTTRTPENLPSISEAFKCALPNTDLSSGREEWLQGTGPGLSPGTRFT